MNLWGPRARVSLVVAATTLLTSPAFALAPVARLAVRESSGVHDCPTVDSLARAVDGIMGRRVLDPSVDSVARATIIIEFHRDPDGVLAAIRAVGAGKGTRDLHAAGDQGCTQLAEVLPPTLAIIVDSIEWQMANRPPTADTGAAPNGPAPPQPDNPWHLTPALEAGGLGAFGLLPSPAPGAYVEVGVQANAGHSLALGVLWAAQQDLAYQMGTVGVSLQALTLRGCGAVAGSTSLRMLLCGVPTGGVLRGKGDGYTIDGSATRPWLALAAELSLQGRIWEQLGWSARIGGLTPITRDEFTVGGLGSAWHSSPIAGYAGAGLRWSFL